MLLLNIVRRTGNLARHIIVEMKKNPENKYGRERIIIIINEWTLAERIHVYIFVCIIYIRSNLWNSEHKLKSFELYMKTCIHFWRELQVELFQNKIEIYSARPLNFELAKFDYIFVVYMLNAPMGSSLMRTVLLLLTKIKTWAVVIVAERMNLASLRAPKTKKWRAKHML